MFKQLNITVIIPAYNAESFIIDALESVSSQTLMPSEVIVVNDGSTDQTADVIAKWIASHPVKFAFNVIQQANQGLPVARNVGIANATAEWIALLDADDIWEACHLQVLNDAIMQIPTAIAAYGAGRLLVGKDSCQELYDNYWGNPAIQLGEQINDSLYSLNRKILPRLFAGNFIKPSSLLFSRSITNKVGLFNETLKTSEDREFLVRLICEGKIVYSYQAITQYRWHDDNISQAKNSKRNMENGLHALNIIRRNASLNLNQEEIFAWQIVAQKAIEEYLFICAQDGLRSYYKGFVFVNELFLDCIEKSKMIKIKHILHGFSHFT